MGLPTCLHNSSQIIASLDKKSSTKFDNFAFYIDPEQFIVKGLEEFEGVKITLDNKHKIKPEYLRYHMLQYNRVNN